MDLKLASCGDWRRFASGGIACVLTPRSPCKERTSRPFRCPRVQSSTWLFSTKWAINKDGHDSLIAALWERLTNAHAQSVKKFFVMRVGHLSYKQSDMISFPDIPIEPRFHKKQKNKKDFLFDWSILHFHASFIYGFYGANLRFFLRK